MDLAIGITVGASTQVALLVAPVLVFLGYLMGQDMELVFSQFELVSIILAVMVTRTLISRWRFQLAGRADAGGRLPDAWSWVLLRSFGS